MKMLLIGFLLGMIVAFLVAFTISLWLGHRSLKRMLSNKFQEEEFEDEGINEIDRMIIIIQDTLSEEEVKLTAGAMLLLLILKWLIWNLA